MLAAVKKALCLTTDAYDDELSDLIAAAIEDLRLAGIIIDGPDANGDISDSLIRQAVKTYVRCHFKSPDDFDRLAAAYDAQKGALQIATGYTDWGQES